MKAILKQYKNLILLVTAVLLVIALIAADPLGFCTQRTYERASIRNQMEIDKAQTEREIAIIKAQTEAELLRIRNGETVIEPPDDNSDTVSEQEE